ncbi:MAG TPA: hypothetical protein V6D47_17210 [Oscillatoriaceae cyanobacterium]
MSRQSILALLALATLATGCGQQPTTGVPYTSLARPVAAAPLTAPTNGSLATQPAATAAQTGTLALNLSSLAQDAQSLAAGQGLNSLEIQMTGPGLASPLVKQMAASDLSTSNTITFHDVPAAGLTITLTGLDAAGQPLGEKSTSVQVQPNQQTTVNLQLALAAPAAQGAPRAFSFDVVNGDVTAAVSGLASTTLPLGTDPLDTQTTPQTSASDSSQAASMSSDGALGIQILSQQVERKYLILKRLTVQIQVTNHNAATPLNGEVKVDFYHLSGLFTKTNKLVQTLTQDVQALPPGQSTTLTFTSTTTAESAQATVQTVVSSASADTGSGN